MSDDDFPMLDDFGDDAGGLDSLDDFDDDDEDSNAKELAAAGMSGVLGGDEDPDDLLNSVAGGGSSGGGMSLGAAAMGGGSDKVQAVYDIPVQVSAVLGKATMQVSQLLKLGRGAVVELDRKVGEAIDIYVNNRLVARGEVVVSEDRLGVTLTEIIRREGS